uniref:histone acetyltransferase n=1 Tax=Hemiselmis andersenii TaxID=464988 RepID=A0A6T8N345_HEMAN
MPATEQAMAATGAPAAEGGAGAAAAARRAEPAAEGGGKSSDAPCEVDKLYSCLWNGQRQTARVVERRLDSSSGEWHYYVHYEDYDRRLDEWVTADRMGEMVVRQKKDSSLQAAQDSGQKMTRTQKRRHDEINTVDPTTIDPTTAALEHEREEATKVKNIQAVEFGKYQMDTWYFSPFPVEYSNISKLYMCEFCLKYIRKPKTLERHKAKCDRRHPAGDEIYRHDNVSMFEVDGKKEKVYCQNLCLLSKLFLDHKTLYYDVEPFLFYIMTEVDERGCHVVGYFSKEKESPDDHNLACIMVLPPYQRKQYGRFLISFSYELSKKEQRVGTPERPLSDLGLLSYRSYWKSVLLDLLSRHKGNLSIKDISLMTSIKADDIITTLQSMGLIKYWKGQHLISVSPKVIEDHLARQKKCLLTFDESKLIWTPPSERNGDNKGASARKSR